VLDAERRRLRFFLTGQRPDGRVRRNRQKDDAQEVPMGVGIQIAGALAILVAYALAQFDVLNQHGRMYLVLNFVGASVLAVDAYVEAQWGFLLLEGVWALITAWSLASLAKPSR
jgi:hypothetical protein